MLMKGIGYAKHAILLANNVQVQLYMTVPTAIIILICMREHAKKNVQLDLKR